MEVFDNLRSGIMKDRSQFYKDSSTPFYGANRPGAKVSQGTLDQSLSVAWRYFWLSADALPTEVFQENLTLELNGATLALKYYGPCHTDSDISVEFTNFDILHVADSWWNGHYPFIDYSTGGSIDGAIRAAEANVARVTDKTIIIPGHGTVGDKSQLIEFRDMLVTIRDKVSCPEEAGEVSRRSCRSGTYRRIRRKVGRIRDQCQKISPRSFTRACDTPANRAMDEAT